MVLPRIPFTEGRRTDRITRRDAGEDGDTDAHVESGVVFRVDEFCYLEVLLSDLPTATSLASVRLLRLKLHRAHQRVMTPRQCRQRTQRDRFEHGVDKRDIQLMTTRENGCTVNLAEPVDCPPPIPVRGTGRGLYGTDGAQMDPADIGSDCPNARMPEVREVQMRLLSRAVARSDSRWGTKMR